MQVTMRLTAYYVYFHGSFCLTQVFAYDMAGISEQTLKEAVLFIFATVL